MATYKSPILRLTRAYRHLERLTEIIRVMVKFGFGDLIDRLGLGDLLVGARRLVGMVNSDNRQARPRRLRLALEEMGLVFIKLGQYLSTRQDLLPAEYLDELSLLQDSVPPLPSDQVAKIINEELQEGLFVDIAPEPLAAASVGQVHRATLVDGSKVVVKVRRPGLQRQVTTDLEILGEMAAIAERHLPVMDYVHPKEIVDEFTKNLNTELNYRLEAVSIGRFGRLYSNSPDVKIPSIHKALCTNEILVMEEVGGFRIDNPEALKKNGIDPVEVASLASSVALNQIMTFGLFHADPHPGNIFVQAGPKLVFMDFGLVGTLDRRTRDNLLSLALGVVSQNHGRVVRAMLKLAVVTGEPDRETLEREVGILLDTHLAGSLKDIRLANFLKDVLELLSQHKLRIPRNLFLLVKALTQYESLGLKLDPDHDIVQEARPVIEAICQQKFTLGFWGEVLSRRSLQALGVVENLPDDLSALWRTVKTGRLPIDMTVKDFERLGQSVQQASYRLSFAVVLAALVIGSSVVIHAKVPPLWYGLPILGLAGFLGAAVVGFWLVWDFLRKNKEL
ncbi:MAG: AarF/ABC1/UbiB kinase family protein [Deltaproteobacteria bacterium]|jgi:ubiquinone biosynthesis protein|nr:AarF/ABC1/UbiB kinase family protein [Deltaproteobacteria bacterium]